MNWSSVSRLEFEHKNVRFAIPLCRVKGTGGKKVFITAGHHGIEHTSIYIAYKLFDILKSTRSLNGEVAIVPMVNIEGVRAEIRGNPSDGRVITTCYPGRAEGTSSERIAFEIWERAKESDCVLDLHSAGYARYLQHAIFSAEEDMPLARTFGFDFAIRRTRGKEGTSRSLVGEARRRKILAYGLELGGGHVVFPEDVESGLKGILYFLRSIGCLPLVGKRPLTPFSRIYMYDARIFLRSPVDGVVYSQRTLGSNIRKGEALATCIELAGLRRRTLKSPASGKIIYLRTKARIGQKETVAMILPKAGTARE